VRGRSGRREIRGQIAGGVGGNMLSEVLSDGIELFIRWVKITAECHWLERNLLLFIIFIYLLQSVFCWGLFC